MKRSYELHDDLGNVIGDMTAKEMLDAVRYEIVSEVAVGEYYVFRNGLHEHFKRELKARRQEEKKKSSECWVCGTKLNTNITHKRPYCTQCAKDKKVKNEEEYSQYVKLRKQIMFERALVLLENQTKKIKIQDYREAIENVEEYLHNNIEKFSSKEEVATAIELVKNQIHVKIGSAIGSKTFDFQLPYKKVLLEIDGYLHEYSKSKDSQKDIEALKTLEDDWEVIRVPTKYIAKNISQLTTYIDEAYKYQQKIRKQNNGIMPDYYSDREKEYYKEAVKS